MKAPIIAGIVSLVCVVVVVIGVLLYFLLSGSSKAKSKEELTKEAIKIIQEKCDEYAKIGCSNPSHINASPDDDSARIAGGDSAGGYPHMVHIHLPPHNDVDLNCGGSIVSEEFILTAASCVNGYQEKDIGITIGPEDYGIVIDFYGVNEIIMHHDYNHQQASTRPNDIALLKVNRTIKFDTSKRPICLNTNFSSTDVKIFTTLGYGVGYGGYSLSLQVLDQTTEVQSECSSKYNDFVSSMICARHPSIERSLCVGDTGGPLQTTLKKYESCANGIFEQVGIASNITRNCSIGSTDSTLTLYTKVDRFPYWIACNVWPKKFK